MVFWKIVYIHVFFFPVQSQTISEERDLQIVLTSNENEAPKTVVASDILIVTTFSRRAVIDFGVISVTGRPINRYLLLENPHPEEQLVCFISWSAFFQQRWIILPLRRRSWLRMTLFYFQRKLFFNLPPPTCIYLHMVSVACPLSWWGVSATAARSPWLLQLINGAKGSHDKIIFNDRPNQPANWSVADCWSEETNISDLFLV